MKVLYIGHYKEFGGWSQAATDYILALDKVGVDVVCRNVTLTQDKQNVDQRILRLENKDTDNCDVCIQHVLPHHIVGSDSFKKNIAFLASESTSIKHLPWLEQVKQVDQVWVPNAQSKQSLEEDGIKDVKVVPHTCDLDKYKQRYGEIAIPDTDNSFKFYYIGDVNDRKNLETILTCFYSEFDKSEKVSLILKVKKFGHSEEQITKYVNELSNDVRQKLRMYPNTNDYKKIVIVSEELTNEQVLALHQNMDCFLCPSHGEAWSIPSFDAMCYGNTPICSNFGGPKEFIDSSDWKTGKLIDGVYSVCKCSDAAFPDIFTGREYWFHPCEKQIKEQMRLYFDSWGKNQVLYRTRNQAAGLKRAENFSYKNIGNLMKEIINE
jgi:glycosyltransferase involved in cell wall biosynthesis